MCTYIYIQISAFRAYSWLKNLIMCVALLWQTAFTTTQTYTDIPLPDTSWGNISKRKNRQDPGWDGNIPNISGMLELFLNLMVSFEWKNKCTNLEECHSEFLSSCIHLTVSGSTCSIPRNQCLNEQQSTVLAQTAAWIIFREYRLFKTMQSN